MPSAPGPRSDRRLLLILLAPGLVAAVAALVVLAASLLTPDDAASGIAAPTPTRTASAAPDPAPVPAPSPSPTPVVDPLTDLPPDEHVRVARTAQYIGDTLRFAVTDLGSDDDGDYATLIVGEYPGAHVTLRHGEPFQLPDGRWLVLEGVTLDPATADQPGGGGSASIGMVADPG